MSPGAPAPPLRPVPLRELRLLGEGRSWQVDQPIAGLASLTPVRGQLHARHLGTAVEVEGAAETIVTLCCDRCLQHFNHPLRAEAHELIEIAPCHGSAHESPDPAELPADDRLDPLGSFDPERWLFEQLSLALPLVNRCGDDCPGPARWSSESGGGDPRWAALRSLRSG
jgi:uncharacterized protein